LVESINYLISNTKVDTERISDGSHTFEDLYNHRIILYLSILGLIKDNPNYKVWYAHKHSDGSVWKGWIVVGVLNILTTEQISYHMDSKYEYILASMNVLMLEFGLVWDGYSADDVLDRLLNWFTKQ